MNGFYNCFHADFIKNSPKSRVEPAVLYLNSICGRIWHSEGIEGLSDGSLQYCVLFPCQRRFEPAQLDLFPRAVHTISSFVL